MKVLNLKTIALGTAMVLTLGFGVNHANAQATATIGSTFTTAAALSAAAGTDLDFGTWAINIAGGDTPTIAQAATLGAPAVGTVASVVDPSTIVTNTVAPATAGTVDVTSPITGAIVQIQGNITSDFSAPNVSLGSLTYTDTVATNVAVPAAYDGATFITINASGVAETVGFGGTLTLGGGGGTPPAATAFSDAVIQFDFSY